jgi:hypothetical protein
VVSRRLLVVHQSNSCGICNRHFYAVAGYSQIVGLLPAIIILPIVRNHLPSTSSSSSEAGTNDTFCTRCTKGLSFMFLINSILSFHFGYILSIRSWEENSAIQNVIVVLGPVAYNVNVRQSSSRIGAIFYTIVKTFSTGQKYNGSVNCNFVRHVFVSYCIHTWSRVSSVVWHWAMGWMIEGFDSRRRLGIFLFTTASRPTLGPTQPPIQWVPGSLSLVVKRPGREADHSPSSSAEVKECVEL